MKDMRKPRVSDQVVAARQVPYTNKFGRVCCCEEQKQKKPNRIVQKKKTRKNYKIIIIKRET